MLYRAVPQIFNSWKIIAMGRVWAILIEKWSFDPRKLNINQNTKIRYYENIPLYGITFEVWSRHYSTYFTCAVCCLKYTYQAYFLYYNTQTLLQLFHSYNYITYTNTIMYICMYILSLSKSLYGYVSHIHVNCYVV